MKFCTRTISQVVFSFCLFFLGMTTTSAQNGQFDVRFSVKNFDCASNKLTIVLQVKAHDAAHTFLMGDANYRFDYDPRVIKNPAIISQENFSNQAPSNDGNYIAQNLNGSSVGTTLGTVSLNTIYSGGGLGAKLVPATWTNVSCIRFDVQDATKCFELKWHDDQTFPITGMNEVVLSGLNDGNYDAYVVNAGGVFGNYSQCIPSVCTGITAIDDINLTNKNTAVSGNAATNDASNGGAMTFTLLNQPAASGNIVLNANGTYTYTPATGFVGEHKATYQVCNTSGVCDTATITINVLDEVVSGVNSAPVAQNDNVQTSVNTPTSGNVLNNDVDPNGNTLTVTPTPVTPVTNGTLVLNPDGTFTYTPNNGFVGQDTFRYKVCDNGTPSLCDTAMVVLNVTIDNNGTANDKPNAQDDAKTTKVNTPVTIAVKANDTDPNGNTLGTPSIGTPAARGLAVVNADGTITYTPVTGYFGPDQFTYIVCDNGTPALCDTATVVIDVTTDANKPPVVVKNPITTKEDTTITVCLPVSDPDAGQTLSASLCSGYPKNGTAGTPTVANGQVCFTFTPNPNYAGTDTLCVLVCDNGNPSKCDTAKIPVTVTPVNDPPVVVKTPITTGEDTTKTICIPVNDPDAGDTHTASACTGYPKNGTVTAPSVSNGQLCFTFTPNANYNGTDTLCFVVCDAGGKCDTAKIPLIVTPVNDPPVVTKNPVTIPEDTIVTICQTITDADAGDTHTATLCAGYPKNGVAGTPIITGNQVCFSYKPNANFNGKDTLCLVVCDAAGKCDTAKIPVVVTPVNDPPVVTKVPPTVPEDSIITVCQTITDPDAGDTFTATLCTGYPKNGVAGTPVVTGNQVCFTYRPNPNFSGTDTLCMVVCDGAGKCDTAKIPVTVTPVNDAPVITGKPVATDPKTPITICLPVVDPDLGDTFTPSLCGSPASGTMGTPTVSNGQLCVTYTPAANTPLGTQTLCLRVCDAAGLCDTAQVTINIVPSNAAPIATNDINLTSKNTPTTGNVLTNDSDADGHTLTASVLTPAKKGLVVLNPNGTYTYTPVANFVGTDSVYYTACDNGIPVMCDTALLVIEVRDPGAGVNQAPVAMDDNTTTPENRPITIAVKGNDLDVDNGQTLSNPTLVGAPVGGTPSVNPDGTVTFTPTPGFIGEATFKYQICDNATPALCDTASVYIRVYRDPSLVNVAPIANDDINVTTTITPVSGTVATNDSDPNVGQTLSYASLGNTTKGTVVVNPNGTYTYTANAGVVGLDTFKYKVCDNGTPSLCDTASVIIVINPVTPIGTNLPPVATPDNPVTTTGNPVVINVKANDFDPNGDPLKNPTITTQPTCGTTTVNADGTITFTPNAGFVGSCTFVYEVCDYGSPAMCDTALITVKVLPIPLSNRPPSAINDGFVAVTGATISNTVATNDSDPDAGQTLTYTQLTNASKGIAFFNANGTFDYYPLGTFTAGRDSFKYKVCDNGTPSLCDTAWVFVEYAPAPVGNVAPIALDDNAATPNGTKINIPVKANDGDLNGTGTLGNPTILAQPSCGTAAVLANGTIDFTPNAGFVGDCTFKYIICDNGTPSLCDTASVIVSVAAPIVPANRAPIAQDDATTTSVNTPVMGSVAGNDRDLDAGQTLTFTKLTNTTNGTVTVNPDGSYTYTPNAGFVGRDSFTYRVCDNATPSLCATAMALIVVTPAGVNQNDKPIAVDDQATTTPGTPVTINVKSNDIDPDGPSNTLSNPVIVGTPVGGTAVVNPDGTVTFTPTPGFVGTATFTYKVCDNGSPSLCDSAIVSINVATPPINNVNLAPIAIDDAKSGYKNQTITGTVGTNDNDPNAGQVLSYTIVRQPTKGLVTSFDALTGTFNYTSIANYVGSDYFVYSVCDNGTPSLCDTAIAYLTILDNPCVNVKLKVLLEGPYSTTTGKMRTNLNQRGLLPGQTPMGQFAVKTASGQPYKGAPWNYAGTEGDTVTTYPATVVDWVLVSLRSAANTLVPAWRCAAWLHEDGSITIPGKSCVQIPTGNYFVIIEHRNHMGVMSPSTVNIVNNELAFDFTAGNGFIVTNPPSFGAKAMSNGKWVMYAGDGKKDTQNTNFDINFNDSQLWKLQSGIFDQYRYGDFNLDADVNFSDQVLWKANNGRYSGIAH